MTHHLDGVFLCPYEELLGDKRMMSYADEPHLRDSKSKAIV